MQDKVTVPRRIRSFMRREGYLSPARRLTAERLSPEYVIQESSIPLDIKQVFGRHTSLILEVGFGTGQSLAHMAHANPDKNYLGIEVYKTGIAKLLTQIETLQLTNIRIICGDAIEIIDHMIPDFSINQFQLYFPDPWPKKRHHKRRLVTPNFIQLIINKLEPNGVIHMATDWQEYANVMLQVLSNEHAIKNLAGKGHFSREKRGRPITKFELKGLNQGHRVWDLVFVKI